MWRSPTLRWKSKCLQKTSLEHRIQQLDRDLWTQTSKDAPVGGRNDDVTALVVVLTDDEGGDGDVHLSGSPVGGRRPHMRHNREPLASRLLIEQREAIESNVVGEWNCEFAAARNKRDTLAR